MPLITRVFLKAGMIFFALSLLSGIALQIEDLSFPILFPLFWHMLMLGWITQIIIGVSLWMFPGRKKVESFRNQLLPWLAFYSLNVGLIFRIISEPFATTQNNLFKWILLLSAALQFFAAICYVLEIWPRVMSKKQQIKRRKRKR